MVQHMMDIGETIRLTVRASLFTLMEMCMRENGKMIRRMALEFIGDRMVESTKVFGEMICRRDKVTKNGK